MARINRGQFRRREHHALRTNIRLQKIGAKPTRKEIMEVWEQIRETHRVPKGWKFAIMEWSHSRTGTRGWHEGSIRNLSQFEEVMDYLEENIRIGIDRAKSRGEVWEVEIAMEY